MRTTDETLLRVLLNQRPTHLSMEQLATEAGLSIESLRLALDRLEEAGCGLERHPHYGIRLLEPPVGLLAEAIGAHLTQSRSFWKISVFRETASTNDLAARLGKAGGEAGTVVFAERQTAGRGRHGRRWMADQGRSLLLSMILELPAKSSHWPGLTPLVAVAAARATESRCQEPVLIKWPNDLWLRGRKLGGILTELHHSTAGRPFAVAGLGVNVRQPRKEWPEELRDKAVALEEVTGHPTDRNELAACLLEETARLLQATSPAALLDEYRQRSMLLDQWVEVQTGSGSLTGLVVGIDELGSLLLESDSGRQSISSGEVLHLPRESIRPRASH